MPVPDPSAAPSRRVRQREAAQARAALARERAQRARRRRVAQRVALGAAALVVAVLVPVGLSRAGRADAGFHAAFDRQSGVLDFALPAFGGGTLRSADLRGKPAVVNFYASWCEVCHAELPAFQAVHERLGGRVTFVGVNPQSNDSDASQATMIRETGVRYPTGRDRHDDLLRLFNTTGALPTTVFLDAQGRVVQVHNGGFDQGTLAEAIRQYLGVAV